MSPCLSKVGNDYLFMILSLEEIKNVLMAMPNLRAPELNGFMVIFYKNCWDIVGDKIVEIV